MARVPRAKAIRPSNTVRPTSTHVTSWKSTDSRSPSSTSEDADSDTERQRFRQGWFHSARVRPAGFRGGVTWTLRHRGRHVGLIPYGRGRCGRWSATVPRVLRRPGRPSAVVRDVVVLASACSARRAPPPCRGHRPPAPPLARREGPPRPSPEVLDPFVERHPGR
ncbi:hypothetical protein O1M63_15855 [Streptomyces mirabilis]|nr:hypothetical protein [Streptomyces mirabilis]